MAKETEARLQMERENDRARASERETVARAIAEIRKELPRFGHIEEELVTRQAEDQRKSRVFQDIEHYNSFIAICDYYIARCDQGQEQKATGWSMLQWNLQNSGFVSAW